jgi:hypothetical protein
MQFGKSRLREAELPFLPGRIKDRMFGEERKGSNFFN